MKNVLKSIPKRAGIYMLTNTINSKIYIGKSVNLYSRILSHKYPKPRNYIDHAIIKYGFNNFDIDILHIYEIPPNGIELLALETAFIIEYHSLVSEGGYNICLVGNDIIGIKRSPETRRKMALCKIGSKNPNFQKTVWPNRPYVSYLGLNNPNADHVIHTFQNRITQEFFVGKRKDFYTKYSLSKSRVGAVIRETDKSVHNWILIKTNLS